MLVVNRPSLGQYQNGTISGVGAGPGMATAVGIGGLIATGITLTGVLFHYGIASTTDSKMIKVTGYILTALGALSVLATLAGTVVGTVVTAADSHTP